MQKIIKENLQWLEFDLLTDFPLLKHQLFLRHGGSSEGAYKGLNIGFSIGDKKEAVEANLKTIRLALKNEIPDWHSLHWGDAIHGSKVMNIQKGFPEKIPDADGLMTSTPGLTLTMKNADCQVAFFYDPLNHAIANIHAGWRGSVANIYAKTIQSMQRLFGTQSANLLVCISPSLGPEEFEFIDFQTKLPESFWKFQIRPNFFDFWAISEFQLKNAGVLPHHIEIAGLSTFANPKDFFSHRRDKQTGRHANCLTLL